MRRVGVLSLVLACLLLVGCTDLSPSPDSSEKSPADEDRKHRYSSQIDRVVDGDTVHLKEPVLGSTKVRMLSMDAPEVNYQGKSQGKYGVEATDYLKKRLPEGTDVQVVLGQEKKDDYGRLLAYLEVENQDINEEMVRQGYAVPYFIYPNVDRFQAFREALQQARKEGRGIWNPDGPLEEMPFEFRLRVGNREPNKYVGNFETKEYVEPVDYPDIPLEQRIFFWNAEDAEEAGYKKKP